MADLKKAAVPLAAYKRKVDKEEKERKKRMKAGKTGTRKRARWR